MKPEENFIAGSHNWYIWVVLLISVVLLFFILFGFTYSLFGNTISGEKTPIDTDPNVIFQYSDVNGSGNKIAIKNAEALSDEVGKRLIGADYTFDFTISGKAGNTNYQYIILLEKLASSTLSDDNIKVYLTKVDGTVETEVSSEVPLYSSLEDIVIEEETYKKLYYSQFPVVPVTKSNFSQDYRLRIWIKEDAEDYYSQRFALKLHVLAEKVGEYDE